MKYKIQNHITIEDMSLEEELAIMKVLSLLQIPFRQRFLDCEQNMHIMDVYPLE